MSEHHVSHPHDGPRGVDITLNDTFVNRIGPEGVRCYVDALVAVAGEHADVDALASSLRHRLDAVGIRLPDLSYKHTAEQLVRATPGHLTVRDDYGHLLYGVPEPARK